MVQTDKARQDSLIISSTVLTVLSAIVVLTRLVVRGIIIRKPGWDDYLIFGAMLGTVAYLIEIYVLKANNVGFPMTTLTLDNMTNLLKTTLGIEVTYYAIVSFVKISILSMYLRFGTLAQCQPLNKMWDLSGTVEGHCINTTAFFYFTSGLNILTDVWILALPVKTLVGVNRPTKEKIALVVIFTVGAFATITSIIRLHSIYKYTEAVDPFHEAILVNFWSMIEVNVGIICASVPALKPLFTPHKLKNISRGSGYQYHAKSKSGYISSHQTRVEKGKKPESFDLESMPGHSGVSNSNASESTEVIIRS